MDSLHDLGLSALLEGLSFHLLYTKGVWCKINFRLRVPKTYQSGQATTLPVPTNSSLRHQASARLSIFLVVDLKIGTLTSKV